MERKKNTNVDIYRKRDLFLSISLVISLLIVIVGFEWKTYNSGELVELSAINDDFDELLEIPPTIQPPPKPPKIQQPEIIEIPDEEEIEQEIEVNIDIEMNEVVEESIQEIIIEEAPVEETVDEIFTFVESQPKFKGSQIAFLQFVQNNMHYPPQARRMGIEGRVFVKVVIEKDGAVTNAEIVKGIGGGCNQEALRVISLSPNWIPGKQRGKPVRVSMTFPITFRLNG